jgi:hypothetical protein
VSPPKLENKLVSYNLVHIKRDEAN